MTRARRRLGIAAALLLLAALAALARLTIPVPRSSGNRWASRVLGWHGVWCDVTEVTHERGEGTATATCRAGGRHLLVAQPICSERFACRVLDAYCWDVTPLAGVGPPAR